MKKSNTTKLTLNPKEIILTGSERGLGSLLYKELKNSYRIMGSSRHPKISDVFRLDFHLMSTVRPFLKTIFERHSPKALIQNIGMGAQGHPFNFSHRQIREIYEVNFFGPFFLIKEFFKITNSKGKVIIISSEAAKPAKFANLGIYGGAKSALNHAFNDLAINFPKQVLLFSPPALRRPTDMEEPTILRPENSIYSCTKETKLEWKDMEETVKEWLPAINGFISS